MQVTFKGTNILKFIPMHLKDKIPPQLKQTIVYKWSCPEENCKYSYLAIHIRITNPTFNCNTKNMYILEVFNNLLGADGSTKESNQMGNSDHLQGHTYLSTPSNGFAKEVCLAN